MFNKKYDNIVKRIDELECRLENHISREIDITQEIEFERKRRKFYSKIYYTEWTQLTNTFRYFWFRN